MRVHKSPLRLEMLMNLTDIVLVTENDKGILIISTFLNVVVLISGLSHFVVLM